MKPWIFLPGDLDIVEFAPSFASGHPEEGELKPFLVHFAGTELADFFDIWLALVREGQTLPTKRDMGPHRLRRHLGYVGVTELLDDRSEVVLRLAGTALTEYIGREVAGRTINDVFQRPADFIERLWLPLFCEARPRYDAGNLAKMGKAHIIYRALHLPIVDGEGKVRFSIFRAIVSMDGGGSWK